MLFFGKQKKRRRILERPFPEAWREILERNVGHCRLLDEVEREKLHGLIQVFVAEKRFEGAGGLEMEDEIRVTIAAQDCLLLLGLPHDYYRNVRSIIVYPSTVIAPREQRSSFDPSAAPVQMEQPILGQAILRGPVILVWDAALRGGRHPRDGHNVIYHEFAHKLDMLDGSIDGTPPLRDRGEYRDYIETCTREFRRLEKDLNRGRTSFLDAYASTNAAEFFAVATEQFFERPLALDREAPELYRVLRDYYQQDPAAREKRKSDS